MTTNLMSISPPALADDAALRAAQREDQRRLSARYLRRLNWTRECLDDERRRRLQELVAIAQQRSPWHRQRLGRVDARSLQERDLSRLPVMCRPVVA